MTIDRSGMWWTGSGPEDVLEYLKAYNAAGYEVHEARLCKCGCGSAEFELKADRTGGNAERTCARCGARHLICDSAEHWNGAEPDTWTCTECGSRTCNLGAGFSFDEPGEGEEADIRWLSLGERCTACGTLGAYADWKIGYGPSRHLVEQA